MKQLLVIAHERGLISTTYYVKNSTKLGPPPKELIKKEAKEMNRDSLQELVKLSSKYIKKCSICSDIREMQIKMPLRFCLNMERKIVVKKSNNSKGSQDPGQKETLLHSC